MSSKIFLQSAQRQMMEYLFDPIDQPSRETVSVVAFLTYFIISHRFSVREEREGAGVEIDPPLNGHQWSRGIMVGPTSSSLPPRSVMVTADTAANIYWKS